MRTLILALLALTLSARADVVVYKGTGTCRVPNDVSQYSKTPHLYYVVDLVTRESLPLFFFTLNGKKKQSGSFPLSPTRYATGAGNGGKTLGTFTFVFDDGGTNNFSNLVLYFRGKQTVVPLSGTKTGNFPKTLSGVLRGASRTAGNSFIDEINFVLTFDAIHTQNANNALKSGQTTYGDLQAELTTKGYP